MRGRGASGQGAPTGLRRRGGFTLVEVLIVSAVVSIVARIAIPNVQHVLTEARAAEVLAQVNAIRHAAFEHEAELHEWPEDAPAGEVPASLRPFLAEGFSFRGDGYTLDYESWVLPSGLPGAPTIRHLAGVTVVADSDALTDALRGLTGDGPWFAIGDAYTFLITPR